MFLISAKIQADLQSTNWYSRTKLPSRVVFDFLVMYVCLENIQPNNSVYFRQTTLNPLLTYRNLEENLFYGLRTGYVCSAVN